MDISYLSATALFSGIRGEEFPELLSCLSAHERTFRKDETIWRAGDAVREIGLVESGSVNSVVNLYGGGSSLFAHTPAGDIFAESFAALPGRELLCDVIAAEESRVLFLDIEKLYSFCAQSCSYHRQLLQNLLMISAAKNMALSLRMLHTAPKTIRERLLSYFSEQAAVRGDDTFTIPFSRQQLADYLGVDRSALSNELGKMRRNGLIEFRKNTFTLLRRKPE